MKLSMDSLKIIEPSLLFKLICIEYIDKDVSNNT